jgi:hypothetical protein
MPTTSADGLAVAFTSDPDIFSPSSFYFEDLPAELRDFSLRRRVDVAPRGTQRQLLFAMKHAD